MQPPAQGESRIDPHGLREWRAIYRFRLCRRYAAPYCPSVRRLIVRHKLGDPGVWESPRDEEFEAGECSAVGGGELWFVD